MKSQRISENEYKYVREVLDNQFRSSKGSYMTKKLETHFQEKFNVKHAIAHSNGTVTMHCALLAAGIQPGDEVIVPPLTMSSTTFAVLHASAVPIYADVDNKTFVISAESIRQKISPKTKAIITVALYGLSPDMDAIMAIARQHNLIVIEDNAQCFLGTCNGKIAGSIGHMASFSFQSSKHITCGEGGMLVTNDDQLAEQIRKINCLGYAGVTAKKPKISKEDIQDPNYERHVQVGFNFRISEICAAVALAQLERLEELVAARIAAANAYAKVTRGFSALRPQLVPSGYINSYWTYVLVLEHQDISWHEFRKSFVAHGGEGFYSAWKLTYQEPVFRNKKHYDSRSEYLTNIYKYYDYDSCHCPNAEYLQPRMIQLQTNYFNDEPALEEQLLALEKTCEKLFTHIDLSVSKI